MVPRRHLHISGTVTMRTRCLLIASSVLVCACPLPFCAPARQAKGILLDARRGTEVVLHMHAHVGGWMGGHAFAPSCISSKPNKRDLLEI